MPWINSKQLAQFKEEIASLKQNNTVLEFLKAIPQPVIFFDSSFKIIYHNQAVEQLMGKIEGKHADEIITSFLPEIDYNPLLKIFENKRALTFTTTMDIFGQKMMVQVNAAPLLNSMQKVLGIALILNDVTEYSKKFDELEQSQQLAQLLDHIPTPIFRIDRDFNITYINEFGAALFNQSKDSCLYRKCYDLFKTPQCQTTSCSCHLAMKEKRDVSNKTVIRPDSMNLAIHYTAAPIINPQNGEVTGAVGYLVNIDETVKLVEKMEQVVKILEDLPVPVVNVDRDMNVTYINPAGARAIGKDVESCIGEKCFNLFRTDHCHTSECCVKQAMETDCVCTGKTIARPQGKDVPIMYTGAPIKDHSGAIVGGLEYVVDISEISTMQERLKKVASFQKQEIAKILQVLNQMAEGDLSVKYEVQKTDDPDIAEDYQQFSQLSNALQATITNLNDLVGQLLASVNQLTSGAQQVSDASQAVSQSATEQASSVEEITAFVSEMNKNVKRNTQLADQAKNLAGKATQTAAEGRQKMDKMFNAMKDLSNSSTSISNIIKIIDELAFQTNLLSLNAAVEAARAGAYGKSFAVVAEEVRNLAHRSAKAAKETSELIEEVVEKIKRGETITRDSSEALDNIITDINKISDSLDEITASSREQMEGFEHIDSALAQIDKATQANAASAEESASAAEELFSQANLLHQLGQKFKIDRLQLTTTQMEETEEESQEEAVMVES